MNHPPAQYENVLKISREAGLAVTTYIILGIPTQPIEEIRRSIEYLKSKHTLISPSIFYNVPGMPIFDKMKSYELNSKDICRRSSSFNIKGENFTSNDIVELFRNIRENNLNLLK